MNEIIILESLIMKWATWIGWILAGLIPMIGMIMFLEYDMNGEIKITRGELLLSFGVSIFGPYTGVFVVAFGLGIFILTYGSRWLNQTVWRKGGRQT